MLDWLRRCPPDEMFVSTVTLAEIAYGVFRLSESAKRRDLLLWLETLPVQFGERLLPVDGGIALAWGRMRGDVEREVGTPPVIDGYLAATAAVHGLTIVTRNVRDFAHWGVPVLDLWQPS